MKINFTNISADRDDSICADYRLAGQNDELTTDVNPAPFLRIKGINTFQSDYIRNEEIRIAIRIKE